MGIICDHKYNAIKKRERIQKQYRKSVPIKLRNIHIFIKKNKLYENFLFMLSFQL